LKKSLIALVVFAVSGTVMAQSSVTLYGIVDTGIAYEDNGSTTVTRMDPGNLNGNRWGLKGSEDLGGGLKAIFNLESGFTLDNGAQADTKRLFNRLSWVGVKSGFGTVKLGRQKSPVYATKATWD
jgi:predicted porin